ncbi:hypothetical protein ABPG75_011310 [Micractinium tetrahymenae]
MPPCPLLGLPDELLTYILELVGQSEGPSVTLVCKRFRSILFSAPGLWQRYTVLLPSRLAGDVTPQGLPTAPQQQAWVDARLSVLQRVAHMVQVLQVRDGDVLEGRGDSGLTARFLCCLSPAAAREVQLEHFYSIPLPAQAMAALAPLTQLQRLELTSDEVPANAASTLCQLSASLRSLFLEADTIPLPAAEVLPQLQQLTSLQFWSYQPLPRFDWRLLTALHQLQHLSLCQTHSHDDAQLEPPPPTTFPAHASFHYSTDERTIKLAGCELHMAQNEHSECRPAGNDEEGDEHAAAQRTADESLYLLGMQRLPALCPLLDSLHTPLMPLRRLYLELCTPVAAAAVAGCQHQLSTLTALSLAYRGEAAAEGLRAVLQALMEQAPLLAELRITGCLGGAFPDFLLHRTALRELHLSFNGLAGLPPGPYLAGLQALTLCDEGLRRLPASLAAASALTSLDVSCNDDLHLFAADMDAYVSPRLRHLGLAHCRLTLLPAFSQLSGLTSLDLASNAFTALPPALARATSLVSLDLSHMDCMAVTTADVDALLARRPRLARLQLACTGGRPDVFEHLQRVTPHIKRY